MDDARTLDPDDWYAALATLEWQVDLGVCEATSESPIDRYALSDRIDPPRTAPPPAAPPAATPGRADPLAEAAARAASASDLGGLRAALGAFDLCDLKRGARNLVFADGQAGAHLMIVGDPPGRAEDIAGRPFGGEGGALLDRMLAAIGLAREAEDPARAAYLVPILPWPTPAGREPLPEEIALMAPFLMRHVALAAPRVLIAMGNAACLALTGQRGIQRLRGTWGEAAGLPLMPMVTPAHLLRAPDAKRDAWADLLAVRARLEATR